MRDKIVYYSNIKLTDNREIKIINVFVIFYIKIELIY